MGTRHWPYDAEEAVAKLEVEIAELQSQLRTSNACLECAEKSKKYHMDKIAELKEKLNKAVQCDWNTLFNKTGSDAIRTMVNELKAMHMIKVEDILEYADNLRAGR